MGSHGMKKGKQFGLSKVRSMKTVDRIKSSSEAGQAEKFKWRRIATANRPGIIAGATSTT